MPFLAVPLFALFGRNKFYGYIQKRQFRDNKAENELAEARTTLQKNIKEMTPSFQPLNALAQASELPQYSSGNELQLLIDGEATYKSIFDSLEKAQSYILFQFYIFRDDATGRKFTDLLKKKAAEGVKVYFLYDSVGTTLRKRFIKDLEAAGIRTSVFRGMKRWFSPIQVNFRNHRKIVVVDGDTAFTGGINVGDDYLGLYPKVGHWRDTHIRVQGPAALAAQVSFIKDWHWATEEVLDLEWKATRYQENANCLFLATSPSDLKDTCLLSHMQLINSAQKRIWIANPYFVPPEAFIQSLKLARLRGVEIKIIIPERNDNRLVQWASEVSQESLLADGAEVYAYNDGFVHQKVILIDDTAFSIGSINLDSRSFFINFEATLIGHEPRVVSLMEKMILTDLTKCQKVHLKDLSKRRAWRKIRSRASNLLSPML